MAGELAYKPGSGQLVYSPATGQLALGCLADPCANCQGTTAGAALTSSGTCGDGDHDACSHAVATYEGGPYHTFIPDSFSPTSCMWRWQHYEYFDSGEGYGALDHTWGIELTYDIAAGTWSCQVWLYANMDFWGDILLFEGAVTGIACADGELAGSFNLAGVGTCSGCTAAITIG